MEIMRLMTEMTEKLDQRGVEVRELKDRNALTMQTATITANRIATDMREFGAQLSGEAAGLQASVEIGFDATESLVGPCATLKWTTPPCGRRHSLEATTGGTSRHSRRISRPMQREPFHRGRWRCRTVCQAGHRDHTDRDGHERRSRARGPRYQPRASRRQCDGRDVRIVRLGR
jgi:hypothetical protein